MYLFICNHATLVKPFGVTIWWGRVRLREAFAIFDLESSEPTSISWSRILQSK